MMRRLERIFCQYCKTEFEGSYRGGELHVYDPLRDEYSTDCPWCGSPSFSTIDGTPLPRYQPDAETLQRLVELTAGEE